MKKLILLFTAILTVFLLVSPVYAADITLSSSCSLADAIIAANNDRAEGDCPAGRGADTIILSQDITLRAELPAITSKITIEGNGYTISGNNRYRIFYNDGGTLTIKDLTMTNGYVEGDLITNADRSLKNATANPIGGVIVNWQGTLTVSDSIFSDNLAEYFGGAIYNNDKLSISDSTFSRNLADEDGGAIYDSNGKLSINNSTFSNNSADDGGAIYNNGKLSISDSAFSGNSASDDGGAISNYWGELSIVNSTFSRNSAKFGGGAISNTGELSISDSTFIGNSDEFGGGAIENWGDLSITNSTFSGNSADRGNNFYVSRGGAIENADKLSIINSTFSGNSADKGGAIFNGEDGKLRIINSIIAGRGRNACYSDGRLRHNISNFIQDGSCSSDLSGDPKLGELVVPEDGSPAYFPLLAGSPAIDAADDGYCPETDQIGTARPQGVGCDIGSIEYAAP